MAKQVAKTSKLTKTTGSVKAGAKSSRKKVMWENPLSKENFIIGAIGVGIIILGYILMATGITNEPALASAKWNNPMAVVVAPIVLVFGYCAVIPYALLKRSKKADTQDDAE